MSGMIIALGGGGRGCRIACANTCVGSRLSSRAESSGSRSSRAKAMSASVARTCTSLRSSKENGVLLAGFRQAETASFINARSSGDKENSSR